MSPIPADHRSKRWQYGRLKRLLRPASRLPLDAWVGKEADRFSGLVLNVGSGDDRRAYGSRTVMLDRYAPGVTVRADTSVSLPFRDACFDGLLCTEVLEHLPDPGCVLAEARRVLKTGGVALLTIPFVFHYHDDPADYVRLTPPGLRLALERAGFAVEFVAGTGGKFVALLMLIESVNLPVKACLRTALLPVQWLFSGRKPVNGRWSDYASNVVAVARAVNRADR